jgi:hypothetical protein
MADGHVGVYDYHKYPYNNFLENREVFTSGYSIAVRSMMSQLFYRLAYSDQFHAMALSKGLGEAVPGYKQYYSYYMKSHKPHENPPRHWYVDYWLDRSLGQWTMSVNPRNKDDDKNFEVYLTVDPLIKNMNEFISLQQYCNMLKADLKAAGNTVTDFVSKPLAQSDGDIQFAVEMKNGNFRQYFVRGYKGYALIFTITARQNFYQYLAKYKKGCEEIIARVRLK